MCGEIGDLIVTRALYC